jgi:hypothetical protein
LHRKTPERRSYEVAEAIDPRLHVHTLAERLKGMEDDQSGVTGRSDVIHGDVDPILTCHMSLGLVRITYPIDPLEHDMCHP